MNYLANTHQSIESALLVNLVGGLKFNPNPNTETPLHAKVQSRFHALYKGAIVCAER